MTTPFTENIWLGTEANRRAAAPTVIPDQLAIVRSEAGVFLPDGQTPLAQLTPAYVTPAELAAQLAAVNTALQALSARATPAPRSIVHSVPGTMVLGLCERSAVVESGFTVSVVRARLDAAPTGAALIVQIIETVSQNVLYTLTVPDGSTAVDDTNASFTVTDADQLQFNVTQVGATKPGRGLTIEVAAAAGTSTGIGIGTVTLSQVAVGAASITLGLQYTGDTPVSTYTIVTKPGIAAPTSQTDGTTTTVDGAATTAQITGLTSATTYSFAAYPVAGDGTAGTPGTLTNITTAAPDTTPPGPVTGAGYAAGATSITPSWTNPTDADFDHTIIRLKISTQVPFATLAAGVTTPTEGHPAGTTTPSGTGSGTSFDSSVTSFTQTNLNPSTNYVIGIWTVDASGNINPTPVSIVCTTTAAATTGQGLTGQVPVNYSKAWPPVGTDPVQAQDMSAYTGSGQTLPGFQAWSKGNEGPTAHANVGIMTDPLLGTGHYVMFMKMAQITNGWADSTSGVYKSNQGWFYINGTSPAQYTTSGTGWYGSRIQNFKAPSQAWGAWDIEWWIANLDGTVASAIGHASKGITIMLPFPDANWPKREVDAVEIPSGFPQSNIHFLNSSGGNGQLNTTVTPSGLTLPNIFSPVKTTVLLEPPPAGTGGTITGQGRLRIFHQQTGTAGGAVQTWLDTNKPYVGDNLTDAKVDLFLQQAQAGHIGIAVAYQSSSITITNGQATGSNFSAASGTGTNQRTGHMALIRSITQWAAA